MDSSGNIYQLLGEADKRGVEQQIKEKLIEIPRDQEVEVKSMNRQQRREWYRSQAKAQKNAP